MKNEQVYLCDGIGCTCVKKETNHWFKIELNPHSQIYLAVFKWDSSLTLTHEVKYACGESCLLKIISEHIKKQMEEKC